MLVRLCWEEALSVVRRLLFRFEHISWEFSGRSREKKASIGVCICVKVYVNAHAYMCVPVHVLTRMCVRVKSS